MGSAATILAAGDGVQADLRVDQFQQAVALPTTFLRPIALASDGTIQRLNVDYCTFPSWPAPHEVEGAVGRVRGYVDRGDRSVTSTLIMKPRGSSVTDQGFFLHVVGRTGEKDIHLGELLFDFWRNPTDAEHQLIKDLESIGAR